MELPIGDVPRLCLGIVRLEDDRRLVAARYQVPVDAIGRNVEHPVLEPFDRDVGPFKAGVFDKMGFDYDTLKSINPKLISASVNGFGSKGEMSDRPAFDFIAQALSGFMSLNGTEESGPMRSAMPVSDLVAGLYCSFGIVCALHARLQTGKGQQVESCLTSGLISMMAYLSSESFVTGKAPKKSGNNHPILAPYGIFQTSDGEVAVAPASDKFCNIFLECTDLTNLLENELYKNNANRMKNRETLNHFCLLRLQ